MSLFQWLRSLLPQGRLWRMGAVMFLKISDKKRVCVYTFDLFVCVLCFWLVVCALWECSLKLSIS